MSHITPDKKVSSISVAMQMILVLFRLPKAMQAVTKAMPDTCLLYTSDAADES